MVTRGVPIGCGGILIIVVLTMLLGGDPQQVIDIIGQGSGGSVQPAPGPQVPVSTDGAPGDQMGRFASQVLASTEDTWGQIFRQQGSRYPEPTLVLFSGAVQSACGFNSAAVGPFYCPADQQIYIDLSFFDQLSSRFGAPGDFAQAYVLAHEVGHHIQKVMGISDQVHRARQRSSQTESNALSVRMELQADCLAGVWAAYARDLLEPGDVEEGLRAAAAIGDDNIQRQSGGYVRPESWTHGSSQQRVEWLRRGMQSGDMDACNTFG